MRYLDAVLRLFMSLLMALLVFAVTWQILSRYLLSAPSSWTEELARFVLIWIGILGAAYAYRVKMHLGIDLFTRQLQGKKLFFKDCLTAAVIGLFALIVMVFGGSRLVVMTWELQQISPALGIPMAWVYAVLPASGILMTIYALANVHESLGSTVKKAGTEIVSPNKESSGNG